MAKRNQVFVYWPDDQLELRKRLKVLCKQFPVSFSSILVGCVASCIDTIEKELPKKRVFKLNGQDVTL
jgi:hypothetical protein